MVAGIGLLANAVWTAANVRQEGRLERQFAELKEWMGREYVAERICMLRMRRGACQD
ncbi:MAG: hypothetical protein ACLPX8_09540 [Bryobacteraceae bacterium]